MPTKVRLHLHLSRIIGNYQRRSWRRTKEKRINIVCKSATHALDLRMFLVIAYCKVAELWRNKYVWFGNNEKSKLEAKSQPLSSVKEIVRCLRAIAKVKERKCFYNWHEKFRNQTLEKAKWKLLEIIGNVGCRLWALNWSLTVKKVCFPLCWQLIFATVILIVLLGVHCVTNWLQGQLIVTLYFSLMFLKVFYI